MSSVDQRQDDLDPALDEVVAATSGRLRARLAAAIDATGLTRDEVMRTERAIRQLMRDGRAPTPDRFWTTTALPRADRLCRAARTVIDEELSRLTGDALALELGSPVEADRPTQTEDPIEVASMMSRHLETALPVNGDLDALGRWWLRRLRWAARIHALPQLLRETAPTAGLVVADRELQLLDQPPWSHSDRLLSAFELAQAEIRRYGRRRISETTDQLVALGRSGLTTLPA